jgi:hypothetical protein
MKHAIAVSKGLASGAFLLLALSNVAWGAASITLQSGTSTITIDAEAVDTFSPGCVNCTTNFKDAGSGYVNWSGTIGNFSVFNLLGRTKPNVTGLIDLGATSIMNIGAATDTLTLTWTDTDFPTTGIVIMNVTTAVGLGGTETATYTAYTDTSNTGRPLIRLIPTTAILRVDTGFRREQSSTTGPPAGPVLRRLHFRSRLCRF